MEVFWDHGYEAATLPYLLEEMGISRQSLYDTYGDKRALFLAALERYMSLAEDEFERLEHADATVDTVREYAHQFVRRITSDGPRACMVARSSLEIARVDDEVYAIIGRYSKRLERAFKGAVENSMARGDIVTKQAPLGLARALFNSIQGLSVLACSGTSRRSLKDVVDITFDVLR